MKIIDKSWVTEEEQERSQRADGSMFVIAFLIMGFSGALVGAFAMWMWMLRLCNG